ncbi:MAG: serine hydrolase [Clostridiaceae bacterium]|jgi:CubicO group peptidase (beta-lactamase class C family)|nr:serine hydrolase [Clostridiaceae bacterium]
MKNDNKGTNNWEVVSPEAVGIPSKAVLDFINELEQEELCIHGFIMMKDDKVFAEGYYAPFHADFPHRMFSVGKSFTSIAIGLLQEEGKLSIHDRICDYFPDKLPEEGAHPYILQTTIRDMLMMASPHQGTTYKLMDSEDWVKTFFHYKPVRYPGTSFVYDTSATHVLSALVERISQMSLLQYLKGKILDKIGCSDNFRWLTDPEGICQGGSGLICPLRDLTRVASLCLNGGAYNGEQLIPIDYLEEATSKQIDTSLQPSIGEQQGYGYQFWRTQNNGFAMFGMGGQLAICLPEYNFLLTTMADTQGNPCGIQGIYKALWQQILPYLKENKGKIEVNDIYSRKLKEKISKLEISPEKGSLTSPIAAEVSGKRYSLAPNPTRIAQCHFEFSDGEGVFYYTSNTGEHEISFGIGSIKQQIFPDINLLSISSAAWVEENKLHLRSFIIDELPSSVNMTVTFVKNTITLVMKKTAEMKLENYQGFASGEMIDK